MKNFLDLIAYRRLIVEQNATTMWANAQRDGRPAEYK